MTTASITQGTATGDKFKTAGLWLLQIGSAAMFFMAGAAKLSGKPEMVQLFDAIGIGQWFRVLTGAIEVGAAVLLLIPRLAVFGAALLIPTMIGAVLTHLLIVGGSPAVAVTLLVAAGIIVYARREQLLALKQ